MFLIGSSTFLCPSISFPFKKCEKTRIPLPTKFSIEKCSKTKIPGCFNNENNCFRKSSKKPAAINDGGPYFTATQEAHDDNARGIGIVDSFEGNTIFITGATGFLGKVLVEKLLSSTRVGKIYLLIKAKDKDAAFERFTKEIVNSELFKCLKDEHGKSYEAFVRKTLIPIVGDICEPNLGMDSDDVDAIKRDVDVIIESAAITTFNGRYDLLLDANVNAPQRLMRFAKTCKNLKVFAHFSTAFVNGHREGIILEKPFTMGENGRKEISYNFPPLDVAHEMKMAFNSCNNIASTDYDHTKAMRRLGYERAELYGWHNVYQMTKAMGEMTLNEIRGDVPLLIIRPTIIESSFKDPFPGWIQGYRMADPVIIAFGKGQLPAMMGDPEVNLDVIPVDMVVNTTIAAIAKHGLAHKPESSHVYHVASSNVNPLKYSEWNELLYEYFNSTPLFGQQNDVVERLKIFDNFNDFSKYTRDEIFRRHALMIKHTDDYDTKKMQKQCKAKVAYAEQIAKVYEYIGFLNARFDTGNTEKLLGEMSKEEKLKFEVDVTNIEWRKYFHEIHIPGLLKHVINVAQQ